MIRRSLFLPFCALLAVCGLLAVTPACADGMTSFRTPSNNIHCLFDDFDGEVSVRCDIASSEPSYTTPPEACDLDWGSSFYVGARGPGGLTCHGDTVINPGARVLGYGSEMRLGSITCRSEKSGVTCTNASGHGFTVSRARQKIF